MYDVIVRGGTVADGTGAALFDADIAVDGGVVVAVGSVAGRGREEIDASGHLVTPGFVDIHTHFDGQVTWDDRLGPSSSHGVTTVVTGNCGVGFAPCRPNDRRSLEELMAGVEDIPEVVMTEGLPWTWESFPEYLDVVEARPRDVDVAVMLPHSALRVYVMGDRAVRRESATPDDIHVMARLVIESMHAGAIGFGTSRALQHRSVRGEPIPTVRAGEDELRGILLAMAATGRGVFQLFTDFNQYEDVTSEFAMIRRLVAASRRPTSFTLHQQHHRPEQWRELLALTAEALADDLPIRAQVLCRPTGLLLGHDVSLGPFAKSPTYASLGSLPLADRVAQLRVPATREQILNELPPDRPGIWENRFELGDPPDYEPLPETSFAARAGRFGVAPQALAYDALLEDGGCRLILHTFQDYAYGSLDPTYEMLRHPATVLGLGDAGAHLGLICDASYPTTMLTHWARDRTRGPRFTIPEVVRALTVETSNAVGLCDRGRIGAGYRADLNVIDFDRLRMGLPRVVRDLPANGRRIVQPAEGYRATLVGGVITQIDGQATGALPGRLVRGPRPSPLTIRASEKTNDQ